ncbi:MAG: Holliday junction branch migration protein RuvA [Candidatus Azobacteroides sp.]|nr:Holliday junction branch migration protein RuvA [Candidatus Azobacteroides sp.]
MIEYIKGEIVELTPASTVLENNNIGYLLQISLNTYAAISGKKSCKLYVHEAIREDAYNLYGFADKNERDLFLLLISVSGVGANTARIILSSLSVPEIKSAIVSDNINALKSVKGIGAKTAQRIIVDLKDKVKFTEGDEALNKQLPQHNQIADEAVAALVMLGFTQAASQKVISKISKENPLFTVEQMIKNALKML